MRGDPDDDWSRFLRKMGERRRVLMNELASGGCDQNQYHSYCGRIAMIDEVVETSRVVRRGEDIRPPEARPPLRSPEE